jgi:predicted ATP-binding protein involved in virulence
MKLKTLTLSNFRGFTSFECEFNPGLNVIVGQNGFGKTSVLEAISVAYGQYLSAFGTGVDRGVHKDDIHLAVTQSAHGESIQMEYQFPVTVACEAYESSSFADFPLSWTRSLNSEKSRTTQVASLKKFAKYLEKSVQNGESVTLPMFAYYGTGRLWKQKSLSSMKEESLSNASRLEGYRDCMDPESSYNAFARWLRNETIADYERRMEIIEQSGLQNAFNTGKTVRGRLLSAIANAINKVLAPSDWNNVRYGASSKQIIATHPMQGDMPISLLSDGVRNMVGLVADIAYRCVRLNPHLVGNAVIGTVGTVLIDEIDMHLHPEWQQLVLQNLEEAFPNIQFIVTTHSPQVLSTVKKESIIVLGKTGAVQPIFGESYGEASNDILTEVMHVNPKPRIEQVVDIEHYFDMIDLGQHESSEGKALRAKLEETLGTDHHELQKADRKIRRKGLLAQ